MLLGDRFKQWLEATLGETTALTVAARGEISQRTVYNWLSHRSAPGAEALRVLHDLGCNVTWLVTGEGGMYSDTERGRFWAEKNGYKPPKPTAGAKVQDLVKEIETVLDKYRR